MNITTWTLPILLVCTGLSLALFSPSLRPAAGPVDARVGQQEQDPLPQGEVPQKQQRPDDPDTIARRDYMRAKLMYTQNIIEGLTQKDFAGIQTAAEEIKKITESAAWNVVDSDEYRFQSREFQRTVDDLVHAAEGRNIEATTLRFIGLTTKCVDCHEHLRRRSDF